MTTYDCFLMYNELDLLEIRLNILNDYVDYFVISEAEETFHGTPKPLAYLENSHKIIHQVIPKEFTDSGILSKAMKSPNTGVTKDHWWVREFYQKEYIIKALDMCNKSDIIFMSDIDEIWNPKIQPVNFKNGEVLRPIQTAYPFYVNNRSDQPITDWTGTRVSTYETLCKYGGNHMRTEREVIGTPIKDGGWHFSWLGRPHPPKFGYEDPDVIP